MTYEIGQFYLVPCVRGQWHHVVADWPVMGRLHDDAEHIKFKHLHYHIDWRFAPKRLVGVDDGLSVFRSGLSHLQNLYATPLITWDRLNPGGLPAPVMRRRKCHRAHDLPFDATPIGWLPKLEAAYAGCKLGHGHVCPHRGYDLSNEVPDANGIVTCPLHGLRWDMATGALVRRDVHGKWGCR